jgi:DNA modification methylase
MRGRKLRRARKPRTGRDIESRRPDESAPHSRRYAGDTNAPPAGSFLDARRGRGPMPLAAVSDRIVCGEAASVLGRLPAEWCPCAITSPPYWNTVDYGIAGQIGQGSYAAYLDDLDRVWAQVERCLLPNGKFCLNVPLLPLTKAVSEPVFGETHTRVLMDLYSDMKARIENKTTLRLYSLYVWEKQTTEKMFGSYPYPPNLYERNFIEFIAVFVKPGAPRKVPPAVKEASKISQDEWMDLTSQIWWMYPDNIPRLEGHPAPFPEALPNRLIAMYSFRGVPEAGFPGDLILDPLCGSGTTCAAARRLGRRFVGIDLNPAFCEYAAKRVLGVLMAPVVMSAKRPSDRKCAQGMLSFQE